MGGAKTTQLVETFFQMDYRTGEWKRLRKFRAIKPEEETRYRQKAGNSISSIIATPPCNGWEIGLENTSSLNLTSTGLAFSHFDYH